MIGQELPPGLLWVSNDLVMLVRSSRNMLRSCTGGLQFCRRKVDASVDGLPDKVAERCRLEHGT